MPRTYARSWTWRFDAPAAVIWPVLADTARFNEAAGLPIHEIIETPRADGSVDYVGRGRQGPVALEWVERPVNWVWARWFEHRRDFRKGPLAHLTATFRLSDDGAGARGDYTIEAAPANALGRAILMTAFFPSAGRTFSKLAAEANQFALGHRDTPFAYRAPALDAARRRRLDDIARRIEDSGFGHGLARRLADHVTGAQEVDLWRIRPLALARQWGTGAREAVDACLQATRQGLLELHWDILCPRCRVAKASVGALDLLPAGAHCATCNIDYDRDFSKNVELSFRPAPAIRDLASGEYCLFGPMSTPHVKVHVTVAPGETRALEATLAPGPYRLRTLEPGPAADIDFAGGGFPEIRVSAEAVTAGAPAPAGDIVLVNEDARPRTFVVEDRRWAADAFTADRVATFQGFRDLFSDQVLRPGDEVGIARVTLMFTDLSGSTAMYGAIGDAPAYQLVREHFAFLAGLVRDHNGAVVKTIGDAVMAAFHDPGDALEAALAIQREVAAFNARHRGTPLAIKLGLHVGPCIGVTLNGRLDYFGTTVNMAARLQGQSRGGDIVLSAELAAEPAVAERLAGLDARQESAALKGFDDPVPFLRLYEAASAETARDSAS